MPKDRNTITLDKDLLLEEVYNNIALPIVKEIFSKAKTDESPNYIIPSWVAAELLNSYHNEFDALPEETKEKLQNKFDDAIEDYKNVVSALC